MGNFQLVQCLCSKHIALTASHFSTNLFNCAMYQLKGKNINIVQYKVYHGDKPEAKLHLMVKCEGSRYTMACTNVTEGRRGRG